jgi:hypothetical protein
MAISVLLRRYELAGDVDIAQILVYAPLAPAASSLKAAERRK